MSRQIGTKRCLFDTHVHLSQLESHVSACVWLTATRGLCGHQGDKRQSKQMCDVADKLWDDSVGFFGVSFFSCGFEEYGSDKHCKNQTSFDMEPSREEEKRTGKEHLAKGVLKQTSRSWITNGITQQKQQMAEKTGGPLSTACTLRGVSGIKSVSTEE